jgi:hypothetical protein
MADKDCDEEETEPRTPREMLEGFGTALTSLGEGHEDLVDNIEALEAWASELADDEEVNIDVLVPALRVLGELTTMAAILEGMVEHLGASIECMETDLGWKPKKRRKKRRKNDDEG